MFMKNILILVCFFLFHLQVSAQTTISGKITDKNTGEPLIGATVVYEKGKGTASDFDGNYSFEISEGKRNLTISYVGYEKLSYSFNVGSKNQRIDFRTGILFIISGGIIGPIFGGIISESFSKDILLFVVTIFILVSGFLIVQAVHFPRKKSTEIDRSRKDFIASFLNLIIVA